MNLTIDELLNYTDEERAKWENWFSTHGDEPLNIALGNETHKTVGGLILHCFWAELFYAQLLRGDILTREQMVKRNNEIQTDRAQSIFAFGHDARKEMRACTASATDDDWERIRDFEGGGFNIKGPVRKLVAHILVHEIRHFAQIAMAVRQDNLTPPGDHDILFSQSFGPLGWRV
jgi:uncharacterized damage-inducible protein DinB